MTIALRFHLEMVALVDTKIIAHMDVAFVVRQADLILGITDQLADFAAVRREDVQADAVSSRDLASSAPI